MTRHRCNGFPEYFDCGVTLDGDAIFCRDCRERRQRELAAGLIGGFEPIADVLDRFDGAHALCQCGGLLDANMHRLSLLHRKWEWEQAFGASATIEQRAQPRETRRIETTRQGNL